MGRRRIHSSSADITTSEDGPIKDSSIMEGAGVEGASASGVAATSSAGKESDAEGCEPLAKQSATAAAEAPAAKAVIGQQRGSSSVVGVSTSTTAEADDSGTRGNAIGIRETI